MEWICQMFAPEMWGYWRYLVGLLAGFLVSLGAGYVVVTSFHEWQWKWLCEDCGEEVHPEKHKHHIRPSVVGCVERSIFTGFVALYPGAATTAMGL